ncbi:hypothetical protein PFISCL1PPCAC_19415, partial [Pristionchus fissidentatus]
YYSLLLVLLFSYIISVSFRKMEDRYTIELNNRDPTKIDQLYLDNCKSGTVKGLGENLTMLDTLSMVNCGLTSLEGLPLLPELVILDISQNDLKDGLDIVAAKCPKLEKLVLSNNAFTTLEQFEPLKDVSSLVVLDTFQNEVENTEDYRTKVFEMFPSLRDLDGQDVNGEMTEEIEEDETGAEGEDSDADGDTDEEDGPGLSYLENSNIMDDEDETEDYDQVDEEGAEQGTEAEGTSTRRGVKRRHEGGSDEDSKQ